DEDWAAIGRRMARVPGAYRSWVETLDEGRSRGLYAAPRQVRELASLMDEWVSTNWWHDFVSDGPADQQEVLSEAAAEAMDATRELSAYLMNTYLPDAEGTPDAVGAERYRRSAKRIIGADIDPQEAYQWGWSEYRRIR